jgi:predicted lipoprotein with Yx(FWY)xxD motif
MTPSRLTSLASGGMLVALSAIAVTACGGGGATAASQPHKSEPLPAMVGVGRTALGEVLVNSTGRTLYVFKGDSGTTSACTGACADASHNRQPRRERRRQGGIAWNDVPSRRDKTGDL